MKQRIVIGSVLKPVNDARMYEKIAVSLSRLPDYEIHIAGFKSALPAGPANILFHPLYDFHRIHFSRILAPLKFYKLLIKVKPQTVIVTTHELLGVTCMYKILFGARIIYDVQENYYRNIAFTGTFPPVLRQLLATQVRFTETITRPLISHYWLAERNYEKEFSFSRGKSTILENKARRPEADFPPKSRIKDPIRLLYSGTIAPSYGIFEAVDLAIKLHQAAPSVSLTIIGYAPKKEVYETLKDKIKGFPFILLKGGNSLVPHPQILEEIAQADIGLLPYHSNKSTINCIPTKLYEYLAYGLPMLLPENPLWIETVAPYQAGICVDFTRFSPEELLRKIRQTAFYQTAPGAEIFWESDESRLLDTIIN